MTDTQTLTHTRTLTHTHIQMLTFWHTDSHRLIDTDSQTDTQTLTHTRTRTHTDWHTDPGLQTHRCTNTDTLTPVCWHWLTDTHPDTLTERHILPHSLTDRYWYTYLQTHTSTLGFTKHHIIVMAHSSCTSHACGKQPKGQLTSSPLGLASPFIRLLSKLMSARLPQSPAPELPGTDSAGAEEEVGGGWESGWLPFCCWGVAGPPCWVDGVRRPGRLGGRAPTAPPGWLCSGCCWCPTNCSPAPVRHHRQPLEHSPCHHRPLEHSPPSSHTIRTLPLSSQTIRTLPSSSQTTIRTLPLSSQTIRTPPSSSQTTINPPPPPPPPIIITHNHYNTPTDKTTSPCMLPAWSTQQVNGILLTWMWLRGHSGGKRGGNRSPHVHIPWVDCRELCTRRWRWFVVVCTRVCNIATQLVSK